MSLHWWTPVLTWRTSCRRRLVHRQMVTPIVDNEVEVSVTHYTPPPPPTTVTPTFEIQNQNKGIDDIMDIDSNCPYLLFGETTSHLTSK